MSAMNQTRPLSALTIAGSDCNTGPSIIFATKSKSIASSSKFTVPVIFVTAYPVRLMTGQRPEPTFLITKPFREDAVKAIVSQVLFFDQQANLSGTHSASPAPGQ